MEKGLAPPRLAVPSIFLVRANSNSSWNELIAQPIQFTMSLSSLKLIFAIDI